MLLYYMSNEFEYTRTLSYVKELNKYLQKLNYKGLADEKANSIKKELSDERATNLLSIRLHSNSIYVIKTVYENPDELIEYVANQILSCDFGITEVFNNLISISLS